MLVYRDYDQQALDRQYNCRAGVPHHLGIFARWATDGAAFRRSHAVHRDVSYGPYEKQRLDFFPVRSGGQPLLIFIHGGYWQAQDKSDFSTIAGPYLAAGINVALINYRLAPAVKMGEIVEDVHAAIAWLYRNAARFGFSAEDIFLSGHSAGAHLTAIAAGTDWRHHGLPGNAIKAAFTISGLYDLEPIRCSYVNRVVGLTLGEVKAFSPLCIRRPFTVPMILAVGSAESAEYVRHQNSFASRLKEDNTDVEALKLTGRNHYDALDALGEYESAICQKVLNCIEKLRS